MTLLTVLRGKPRASAMYRTLRPSSDRATAFDTSSGPIFDENKFSLAKTHTRNFDSYHNTNTVSSTASVFFFFFLIRIEKKILAYFKENVLQQFHYCPSKFFGSFYLKRQFLVIIAAK
jgi:hypothetical protein